MKLIVTAPAYFPSMETASEKCWLYLRSADCFGIQPTLYGSPCTQYLGEAPMRVDGQIETLKKLNGEYTHVLFTDAWDVMFVSPLQKIIRKYENMGSPECLIGASEHNLNAHPDTLYDEHFDTSRPYPYFTSAMYIAEIPYIVDRFSRMDRSDTHNQTTALMQGWIEGWFRPVIDHGCQIFQDKGKHCEIRGKSVYNRVTGSWPCVLHLSGDYLSPETGRDHLMLPWARELGIV